MKEKLKELYENGKAGLEPYITANGLMKAVNNGWITVEDAVEIIDGPTAKAENEEENISEEVALPIYRDAKLVEISKVCNAVIVAGIDVEFENHIDHFNLQVEDQNNINSLFKVVELGGTEYPYQADDGKCTVYSAAEIAKIYTSAQSHITYHTAYHNALKLYVLSLDNITDINSVSYGMDLPSPYSEELLSKLTVAQTQMEAIMSRLGG